MSEISKPWTTTHRMLDSKNIKQPEIQSSNYDAHIKAPRPDSCFCDCLYLGSGLLGAMSGICGDFLPLTLVFSGLPNQHTTTHKTHCWWAGYIFTFITSFSWKMTVAVTKKKTRYEKKKKLDPQRKTNKTTKLLLALYLLAPLIDPKIQQMWHNNPSSLSVGDLQKR